MADFNEAALNLLLRFMEMAGDSGLPLSAADLEPMLDKLGVARGGQDHFTLVWADYQLHRARGQSASLEQLKHRYPHWAAKFDNMQALEKHLGDFAQVARRKMEQKLQARGYHIVNTLKVGQRSITCLATPPLSSADSSLPLAPVVLKAGFGAYQFRSMKREYLLARTLHADSFLRPIGLEASEDVAWLLSEYCPLGSLDQASPVSHADLWRFWTQSAKSLALLHNRMICHNDIKASNMLLDRHTGQTRVRLADLEHATREGKPVNRQRAVWDHPEWEPGQGARRRDDVYRLGMTIAWLLDPEITRPERLTTKARLETVSELPAPFRDPLIQSLRDENLERIDNGAELHRVLNGSKDHILLRDGHNQRSSS